MLSNNAQIAIDNDCWRRHQSELHADLLALWQLNGLLTVAEDDVEGAACGRREGGSEAVGAESPVDIDGHVAAGAESLDATLVPGLRTGGEQGDGATLALQQHLVHTREATQVAVNLIRRVCIPKVIERARTQQVLQEGVGAVAVTQVRPEVELPTHTPAGGEVAAMVEHHTGSLSQFGGSLDRDVVTGEEAEEMVGMAVVVLGIVDVTRPLHQLTISADAVRLYLVSHLQPLLTVGAVYAQYA